MKDNITAVDVGSSRILVLIGEVDPAGELKVLGIGESKVSGEVQRGEVKNMDKAEDSLKKAISVAEKMAQVKVRNVVVGIGGDSLRGIRSCGVVPILDAEKGVSKADVEAAFKAAQALPLAADTELIDSVVQEFIVDGQTGIVDPIGMIGVRLELDLLLVLASASPLRNLRRLIERCKLKIEGTVVNILAAGEAVLSPDEKELGVVLIDIGANTCSIGVWRSNRLIHLGTLGYGGEIITRDIASGLRLTMEEAELVKIKYGCALASMVDEKEEIEISGLGGREKRILSRALLAEIIEARVDEILSVLHHHLSAYPFWSKLASGIVFVGGGAQLPGLVELSERTFGLATRIGLPNIKPQENFESLRAPLYATPCGILLSYMKKLEENRRLFSERKKSSVFENIKKFWAKLF